MAPGALRRTLGAGALLLGAALATGYPSTVTRARCDVRGIAYRLLPTGHDAPLVAPDLVVAELLRVAGGAR